jgi:hypothetical protein
VDLLERIAKRLGIRIGDLFAEQAETAEDGRIEARPAAGQAECKRLRSQKERHQLALRPEQTNPLTFDRTTRLSANNCGRVESPAYENR